MISVTQQPAKDQFVWRVSYGPRGYVGRRGGDLIIDVEPVNIGVRQVLRGQ